MSKINDGIDRREFVKSLSLGIGYVATQGLHAAGCNQALPKAINKNRLSQLDKNLAIAMWDYGWLLRSYKGGEFENWEKVLDQLVERGYNAIRIDCFPHFVAADAKGKVTKEFLCPKKNWHISLWGNEYTTTINPRQALLKFLPLCAERGVHVGLSTWFVGHGNKRPNQIKGKAEFIRVWDETLTFLDQHNLLSNVMYVDLLNEYPLWHGFSWLTNAINKLEDKTNKGQHKKKFDFLNEKEQRQYNPQQIKFYSEFMSSTVQELSAKWSKLDFFTSQTNTLNTPWTDLDMSHFAALDVHLWFIYNKKFSKASQYFEKIHTFKNDLKFKECHQAMLQYWNANKADLTSWLDEAMAERAKIGQQYNIPIGNTEGWGPVFWTDHPDLSWDWVKEAGEIAAKLGVKNGYKFNCTSNFTHPQFKGIWNDIEWHQRVTSIIKNE